MSTETHQRFSVCGLITTTDDYTCIYTDESEIYTSTVVLFLWIRRSLAETTRILIRRLSLTMTTMRMIVDDCVDSLTVFSGFINRIADKLQQLRPTIKSQGVYIFGHGVQLHIRSVWNK